MTWHDDSEEIREGLRSDVPAVLRWLGLGKPTSTHGDEWRFGRKGSLSIFVSGPKAGIWFDHSMGEGGDLIDLIRRERGGEIRDVFGAARSFLGMEAPPARLASSRVAFVSAAIFGANGILFHPDMAAIGNGHGASGEEGSAAAAQRAEKVTRRKVEAEAAAAEDQRAAERKRATSRQIGERAGPIEATPAAAYLAARGLTVIPDGGALRFVPDLPDSRTKKKFHCMVAVVAERDGTPCAIHRTFLHRVRPEKATEAVGGGRALLGGPGTGGIWLTKHRGPRLYVCEGIETGLSILRADPDAAVVAAISAGGIRKIVLPPEATEVVVLVDDDDPDPKTGKRAGPDAARAAAARWTAEGRKVFLAWPRPSRGGGYDFNDLLRDGGPDAVRAAIDAAEPFEQDGDALARQQLAEMLLRAAVQAPRLPRSAIEGVASYYGPETPDRIADAAPRLRARMEQAAREGVRWTVFRDLRRHAREAGEMIVTLARRDLARARYAPKGDPQRAEFRALAAAETGRQWRLWRAALASAGWTAPEAEPAPLVLRAVAGAGKTHSLLAAVASVLSEVPADVPCRVAVLVPDHGLAAQMAEAAKVAGLAAVVLAGRTQKGKDGAPLCHRQTEAARLTTAGVSVGRFLCGQPGMDGACPHRETCGYFVQAQGLPSRGVLIGTHDAFVSDAAEMPGGVALPAFVVGDETMVQKVISKPAEVTGATLRAASVAETAQA